MTKQEGERLARLEEGMKNLAITVSRMDGTLTELRDASLLHQGARGAHQTLSARRAALITALTSLFGSGITTIAVRLMF
ncbi:MAG: hypothetical protein ACREHV_00945 [Rhizomicrobium sp.]